MRPPTGHELLDATVSKASRGDLLSMREWQILNLETCSPFRDRFFPNFCEKHGVYKTSKFSKTVWQEVWKLAAAQHKVEHDEFLARVSSAR